MADVSTSFVDTAGTALTAHTLPTGGGTFQVPSGGTAHVIGPSGECYGSGSFTIRTYPTVTPAGPDQRSRTKFKRITDVTGINGGLIARGDLTVGSLNGYYLRYVRSSNLWRLDRITANTAVTLGSTSAAGVTNGAEVQLELSAIGDQITGIAGGVTIGPFTDTAFTGTGLTGLVTGGAASSATTGIHFTDFEQIDVATSNAGADQADVEPFTTVTLTGTGTAATWSQTGGTPTVTLGGSGATRTFEAPATMDGTTLTFTYGADTMTVTVLPHNEWWRDAGTWRPVQIITAT